MRTRNNKLSLWLNDDEIKHLDEMVSKTDFDRSNFIRYLIDGCKLKEAPPADYYDLIMQVRRVGSNINQLLKLANAKGIILAKDLRQALDDNHKVEKMLWDTFTV